jgi:putative flippase GtrA
MPLWSRYIGFVISRLLGTVVDTMFLWIFSRFVFSTYTGIYITAPAISFEIAMLFNYVISYFWIWNKRITVKTSKTFFTRLALFNASCVVGFFIKLGFLVLFERLFRWDVVYCNLMALVISGLANFAFADFFVFKNKQVKKSTTILHDGSYY